MSFTDLDASREQFLEVDCHQSSDIQVASGRLEGLVRGTLVVVEPHVLQAGKLKLGGEIVTLRTLVGLTGADGHAENVGLAILFLVELARLLYAVLCCAMLCAGEIFSWAVLCEVLDGMGRKVRVCHLCACISDGFVEGQELFLVLLVGELEHGDSVDALGHFDGI